MRKIIISLLVGAISLCANAQKDVTKFLGIPVDGTKTEMIKKLKDKGFRSTEYDKDILEGEFNGRDVILQVVTNRDKVYRIVIMDANEVNERAIQIRFNTLCNQFENNSKYISLGDQTISDTEDISHEMTVNNKRYEAIYYQRAEWQPGSTKAFENYEESAINKPVWFVIAESLGKYGKYVIAMYYDNEYNRANGEDL